MLVVKSESKQVIVAHHQKCIFHKDKTGRKWSRKEMGEERIDFPLGCAEIHILLSEDLNANQFSSPSWIA